MTEGGMSMVSTQCVKNALCNELHEGLCIRLGYVRRNKPRIHVAFSVERVRSEWTSVRSYIVWRYCTFLLVGLYS